MLILFSCGQGTQKSGLFADKVKLNKDFIFGADVSSLLALEASGVKYYNFDGQEQDMLKTLSEAGFNYIRVRVWNDPFDEEGNGYGGGNCDINTAQILGLRAKQYGMKLLVNFHYSDFWADPAKQQAPKEWANLIWREKAEKIYAYTKESLARLLSAGVDVGMVQIGNENNTGLCGERSLPDMAAMFAAGARAAREISAEYKKKIDIVIHMTNPESFNFMHIARVLEMENVDYDIFASSYYPFWHGTTENLTNKLKEVADNYGKKVMIAETAYAYSWEDFDGHANTIGEGAVFDKYYPLTVQGQARAINEAVKAIAATGKAGVGVFYWEPGWIPVPGATWEERSALWEKHGSGWASSFAAEYDPHDAGVWYGGSACDNQALFDARGYPLESLKTFKYCITGASAERKLDEVSNTHISVRLRNPIILPETVLAVYNDGATEQTPVVWDNADLEKISLSPIGVYPIKGTAYGLPVTCYISMEEENYIENHSFENEDRSMWRINKISGTNQLGYQDKTIDAKSGRYSLHFWDDSNVEFTVEQTVTGLRPGTYSFSISLQGGDAKNQNMYIYAISGGEEYRMETDVDKWVNWRQPKIERITTSGEITVGVYIKCSGGWGTMDDFLLNPVD